MSIEVVTFQDWRRDNYPKEDVVVTVSKAEGWSRGLSPFVLGPCPLWGNHVARNVENAWQFHKAHAGHIGSNGMPNKEWLIWAQQGWSDPVAHRYPMGKGAKPVCSFWWSHKRQTFLMLDYVTARKYIYIPVYSEAVLKSAAWPILQKKYTEITAAGRTLYLVDFDAYPYKQMGMSYSDVVNNPDRSMGHAYVLAMMLEHPEEFKRTVSAYVAEREA